MYVCIYIYIYIYAVEACGILASRPGMEPTPPALEGEVLTLDCQGSPLWRFLIVISLNLCLGSRV